MRNKKYFIVLFIFIAYAVYDFGGMAFTDGLYSPLVLYGCYIFLMADKMNELTAMSIYRYHSVKNLYIQYMKNQMMAACVYLAVFFAAGMITGVASAVFDRGFFVSCGAMIKFLITSYVNLLIIGFLQLVLRILLGKKGAAGALVLYLVICVLKFMAGRPFIQPFILDTAYYRWKWIAAPRTVINYGLCVLIVIGLAYLPYRQDRKIR